MQQGHSSNAARQEAVEVIRFQQSLLQLGLLGKARPARKKPKSEAETPARQLAAWADQLGPTGTCQ